MDTTAFGLLLNNFGKFSD